MRVSIPSQMLRLAISLGVIAGIVALCVYMRQIHVASAVLALLLAILIIASRWGFVEAAAATRGSAWRADWGRESAGRGIGVSLLAPLSHRDAA